MTLANLRKSVWCEIQQQIVHIALVVRYTNSRISRSPSAGMKLLDLTFHSTHITNTQAMVHVHQPHDHEDSTEQQQRHKRLMILEIVMARSCVDIIRKVERCWVCTVCHMTTAVTERANRVLNSVPKREKDRYKYYHTSSPPRKKSINLCPP